MSNSKEFYDEAKGISKKQWEKLNDFFLGRKDEQKKIKLPSLWVRLQIPHYLVRQRRETLMPLYALAPKLIHLTKYPTLEEFRGFYI